MDDSDEDAEPSTPQVDTGYLTSYRAHIYQTQAHLAGNDGTLVPSSFIPPAGYWSSADKNAFFHGLSVYSRLRPDLIAECIPNKSIADVCVFMDLLEDATKDDDVEMRDNGDIAMEVSEEWIMAEERAAESLLGVEAIWEEQAIENRRQQEIEEKKATLRAARGESKAVGGRDRDGEKQRHVELKQWVRKQQPHRDREGVLQSLDLKALKTLDGFLRTEEVKDDEERVAKVLQRDMGPGNESIAIALDGSGSRSTTLPADTIPRDVSPSSRLRIQKRLHMRRKRAERAGIAVSTDLSRLKVGRKHSMKALKHGPSFSSKLRAQFIELGVGIESLQEDSLGILHLGALGKLMK
jgi:hypothetical protein